MKPALCFRPGLALVQIGTATCRAADVFRDDFINHLANGWPGVREGGAGWRPAQAWNGGTVEFLGMAGFLIAYFFNTAKLTA